MTNYGGLDGGVDLENARATAAVHLMSGNWDPSLNPTEAPAGTVYMGNADPDNAPVGSVKGKFWQKQDNGMTMNWLLRSDASGVLFTPAVPANWPTPLPTTAQEAFDKLAALNIPSKILYVDGNRVDTYTANGSIDYPFKTINAATAVATSLNLIKVMPKVGGYVEDVTLPAGVSIEGIASNNTIITGNLITGAAVPCSVKYLTLNGVAKTFTINAPCSISDVFSYNQVIVNGVVTQGYNFHITTDGVSAVVINGAGAKFQDILCTIATVGDVPAIISASGGAAILELAQISGSRAAGFIIDFTSGSLSVINGAVINAGGGSAINCDDGALAANPNILHGVITLGASAAGAAVTLLDNVTGVVTGTAISLPNALILGYTAGVPASWVGPAPVTVAAALDRIASAVAGLLGAPIP